MAKQLKSLCLIVIIASCQNIINRENTIKERAYNINNYYEAVELKKWRKEVLSCDSAWINGKIPVKTSVNALYDFLGKPDKITAIPINRNNAPLLGLPYPENGEYLYYGETIFEKYGEKVIVNTVDMEDSGMQLSSQGVTLKKGLWPIDIQKLFPESGRLEAGNGCDITPILMLPAFEHNQGLKAVWILLFKADGLHKVVLFNIPGTGMEKGHYTSSDNQIYSKIDTNAVILSAWRKELLNFDSVLINGKLPLVTTRKWIVETFGDPERINANTLTISRNSTLGDHAQKAQYLIYGNTVFERFNDDMILHTIDFESTNVALVGSKITLEKGMTPGAIQSVFPQSCLLSGYVSQQNWDGVILLSAFKTFGGLRDLWFLIFKEGKLSRVELFLGSQLR